MVAAIVLVGASGLALTGGSLGRTIADDGGGAAPQAGTYGVAVSKEAGAARALSFLAARATDPVHSTYWARKTKRAANVVKAAEGGTAAAKKASVAKAASELFGKAATPSVVRAWGEVLRNGSAAYAAFVTEFGVGVKRAVDSDSLAKFLRESVAWDSGPTRSLRPFDHRAAGAELSKALKGLDSTTRLEALRVAFRDRLVAAFGDPLDIQDIWVPSRVPGAADDVFVPEGVASVVPGGAVDVVPVPPGGVVDVVPGGAVDVVPVPPGDVVDVVPGGAVDVVPVPPGDVVDVVPGGAVDVVPGGAVDVVPVKPGDVVGVVPGGAVDVVPVDAVAAVRAARRADATEEALRGLAAHGDERVRLAVAQNTVAPSTVLRALANDTDFPVRRAVAKHPNTPGDVLDGLAREGYWQLSVDVARNPSALRETLRFLSTHPDERVSKAAKAELPDFFGR